MPRLSTIVRKRGHGVLPPPSRRAAARVRPYAADRPVPAAPARSALPSTEPVPAALYARRRSVGPWYERWERLQQEFAAPTPVGDGLDDLRAALAGPVRALVAARPDLARTVEGGDILAGVR